jgi:hypothetical protein
MFYDFRIAAPETPIFRAFRHFHRRDPMGLILPGAGVMVRQSMMR